LTGPAVILTLKIAVATVTALLLGSLAALAFGRRRLHGRLNTAFAALTAVAVLGLELVIRFIDPRLFDYFDDASRRALTIHLCFSVPSAALLPVMLFTGSRHRTNAHVALGAVFLLLWGGTFVTGIFFLPHTAL
jgi:ABC-type spermidine/putrescine transport system permease subunit II